MKYYYAVKCGRTPGIYMSWDDCLKQVHGFSGAVYKKFSSPEEAAGFITENGKSDDGPEDEVTGGAGHGSQNNEIHNDDPRKVKHEKRDTDDAGEAQCDGISVRDSSEIVGADPDFHEKAVRSFDAVAYVDGSFDQASGGFGSGAVIFFKDEKYELSEASYDPELAKMRNVAGEIKAAELAFRFAYKKKASSLLVVHDYKGIAAWCTGEWKAGKKETADYRDIYRKYSERLNISFQKVRGHSGNLYNDEADSLAGKALGKSTEATRIRFRSETAHHVT